MALHESRRSRRIVPVGAVIALIAAGCGGGGGGDDGGDDSDDPLFLLAQYGYAISNPAGAPAAFTRTNVFVNEPESEFEVNAGTGSIRGVYVRSSGAFTISPVTTYTVDWVAGGPVPSRFSVAFDEEASLAANNFQPTGGAFTVTWGSEVIRVTYGSQTTDLSLNGAPAESFTPVDFTELRFTSSGAPDWQRVASLA